MVESAAPKDEVEYFSDSNVKITRTRAIFNDRMYPMANVVSVSATETPGYDTHGYTITLGIALVVCAALIGVWMSNMPRVWLFDLFFIVIAVIVGLTGVIFLFTGKSRPPQYSVVIVNASGEAKALSSENRAYVDSIVASINSAIADRG